MKRLQNLKVIERILNRLKLREKILGLFIFCVIIPLILIDGIIIERIVSEERAKERKEHKGTQRVWVWSRRKELNETIRGTTRARPREVARHTGRVWRKY